MGKLDPLMVNRVKAQALREAADRGDKEMDHYYWGYQEVSETLRKWADELDGGDSNE